MNFTNGKFMQSIWRENLIHKIRVRKNSRIVVVILLENFQSDFAPLLTANSRELQLLMMHCNLIYLLNDKTSPRHWVN